MWKGQADSWFYWEWLFQSPFSSFNCWWWNTRPPSLCWNRRDVRRCGWRRRAPLLKWGLGRRCEWTGTLVARSLHSMWSVLWMNVNQSQSLCYFSRNALLSCVSFSPQHIKFGPFFVPLLVTRVLLAMKKRITWVEYAKACNGISCNLVVLCETNHTVSK